MVGCVFISIIQITLKTTEIVLIKFSTTAIRKSGSNKYSYVAELPILSARCISPKIKFLATLFAYKKCV